MVCEVRCVEVFGTALETREAPDRPGSFSMRVFIRAGPHEQLPIQVLHLYTESNMSHSETSPVE